MGAISGFVSHGSVIKAGNKFKKFSEDLEKGYFDPMFKKYGVSPKAKERFTKLLEKADFTASEVQGFAYVNLELVYIDKVSAILEELVQRWVETWFFHQSF